MELRGSIDAVLAGSNALVQVTAFYVAAVRELQNQLHREQQKSAQLGLLLHHAQQPQGTVAFASDDYVGKLAERARHLTRLTPLLEAVRDFMNRQPLAGSPYTDDRQDSLELLHQAWIDATSTGGMVPPAAPAHPDPVRSPTPRSRKRST